MKITKILDGKIASNAIIDSLNVEISLNESAPKMVVVLIGSNPASESYVKAKMKASKMAGINAELMRFDSSISEENLIIEIDKLNKSDIDGYIVQLPLPPHINVDSVISKIDPNKDIDGFHPLNFGKMALGQPSMKPATPYGILKLIKHYKIETKGKHVVIVGRSNIVGKPLSIMLGNDFDIGRSTCTSCDINTPRALLLNEIKRADIVIIAVGKPNFLTADMVKDGVIVIDVGINRLDSGKLVGDVDFENVSKKCNWITPVPGGVGPMTIAALLVNTLNAWKLKN